MDAPKQTPAEIEEDANERRMAKLVSDLRKEEANKPPKSDNSDTEGKKRGGSIKSKGESKMKHEHHMKKGGHVKHPEHHEPKHHPEHMTAHVHHHKHGGHVDSHIPHHEHIRKHFHGK
jgi:hypothetical protein